MEETVFRVFKISEIFDGIGVTLDSIINEHKWNI